VCNETHRLRGKEGALKLGPFLEESTLREAGGGAQAKGSGVATSSSKKGRLQLCSDPSHLDLKSVSPRGEDPSAAKRRLPYWVLGPEKKGGICCSLNVSSKVHVLKT
jgi:hypothetical protein